MSKKDKCIKLSPKYGVNPCIPICCWCGKEKNEIALLGRLKGDAEAPRSSVLDFEPCDECEEKFKLGVVLIEATEVQPSDKRPPISSQNGMKVYPTFRYSVIKLDAAKRLFDDGKLTNGSRLLIEDELYSRLVGDDNE